MCTHIHTYITYIHTCIHTYIGPTHTDAYNVLSNTHIFYNILLNHVYFHGVNICTHSRSSMHRCSYICILVCYGHFAKLVSLQNVQTICNNKKMYFAKKRKYIETTFCTMTKNFVSLGNVKA